MQCQVGLYFLSHSFLIWAAVSFLAWYFSNAWSSTLHRVLSRLLGISAFLISAFQSHTVTKEQGWPTATVSWGRGWRGSHVHREGVATKPWRILLSRKTFLISPVSLTHYYCFYFHPRMVSKYQRVEYILQKLVSESNSQSLECVMPSCGRLGLLFTRLQVTLLECLDSGSGLRSLRSCLSSAITEPCGRLCSPICIHKQVGSEDDLKVKASGSLILLSYSVLLTDKTSMVSFHDPYRE